MNMDFSFYDLCLFGIVFGLLWLERQQSKVFDIHQVHLNTLNTLIELHQRSIEMLTDRMRK